VDALVPHCTVPRRGHPLACHWSRKATRTSNQTEPTRRACTVRASITHGVKRRRQPEYPLFRSASSSPPPQGALQSTRSVGSTTASATATQSTLPPWTRAKDLAFKPYPPVLTVAPAPPMPDNPYYAALDRVLKEGDPDAVGNALALTSNRHDVPQRHLRSYVLKTAGARNDDCPSAWLATATAHFGVAPGDLLAEATLSGDADLASVAIRMAPAAVTLPRFRTLQKEMPQIARLALVTNSTLADAVGWDDFKQLMVDPLIKETGSGRTAIDDLLSRMEALVRAFPRYAGDIALASNSKRVWMTALQRPPAGLPSQTREPM
jgi:hypothetical protein